MRQKSDTKVLHQDLFKEIFPTELSKADARRLSILEAAIRTYSHLEIDYVTYEDIAREAKVSRPLILHYFPQRRDLFFTMIRFIRAGLQGMAIQSFDEGNDPLEGFSRYVHAVFDWPIKYPDHARVWLILFYFASHDNELKKEHARITRMGMERICAMLKATEIAKLAPKRTNQDRLALAKALQAQITGAFVECMTESEPSMYGSIRDNTLRTSLVIIRSIK